AIGYSLIPRQRDDGHAGMIEVWASPAQRRSMTCRGKKAAIFRVRHLVSGKLEGVHPDTMHGLFIVAPGFATHREPTLWDAHHCRSDDCVLRGGESCHNLQSTLAIESA